MTTCGQDVAASAEIPELWQALMNHVATNLEAHAVWVGVDSIAAKREHDALRRVAGEYRAMAEAAGRAAAAMKAMRDMAAAPHEPSKLDPARQERRMREKIAMQRELARLLLRHAADSDAAMDELDGGVAGQR